MQIMENKYILHEAVNGVYGLKTAMEIIPDLVVSDIMMPEMDGMELCKRMKSDDKTSHIPVILLTAKGDMESKVEGLETGADDYIVKPFEERELQSRVENLIDQRRKLRARYKKEFLLGHENLGFSPPEESFLTGVSELVHKNVSEPSYGVKELADELNMSRGQLYRKILALTSNSVSEFIRNTRLKYAASLFDQGHKNVAQVSYQAGFNSPSYFASCFKKLFEKNPKDYVKG
jgi:YesN/AraC family two-component response regulator